MNLTGIKGNCANNEETTYAYDLSGSILMQTDSRKQNTYEYNCMNLVTRRIDHGEGQALQENMSMIMQAESYHYPAEGWGKWAGR